MTIIIIIIIKDNYTLDGIKLFAKKENELKALIQLIGIYHQYIRMEFGRRKHAIFLMKNRKKLITERTLHSNLERIGTFGDDERNIGSRHPLTSWNERIEKENSTSKEQENFSRPSSALEISWEW